MAQNITLWGASYSDVPSVNLPKTGGGTASFTDVTDTTAAASDVATGKYFYTASGVRTQGTNSGGGGSSVQINGTYTDVASATPTISFTGLAGEPTSFIVYHTEELTTGASPYKVACVTFDGTNLFGQIITNTNNAQVSYDNASFTKLFSNGTLTITSSSPQFQVGEYIVVYSYGGVSACVNTADVQVGSGATSITFTGLEDEPMFWVCNFKSNFGTSNGYQRVIFTLNDSLSVSGMYMDSSANYDAEWTATYNNGSLTITSNGTNNGGYFHQPGYYQLTYVIADASPYEKKNATYRASTSAQTDKIEPSSGYDAMSEVNISIPAVTQTNLTADNIKSGTTVTISNGQSNLWSITGTYGGGGSSKNAQTVQGTTRTTSSTLTAIGAELTVSKTGTYDVYWSGYRSTTSGSYTYGTQLYVGGVAYGTQNTTWTNHVQNNHLSNVSLTQGQKLRVYGRNSRGSSYYIYAPTLVIIEV